MARLPYLVPYDDRFLGDGYQVALPIPSCQGKLVQSGQRFDYINFSLVMHQDRRTALYTAHNIDTSLRRSVPRDGWALDDRIPHALQTGPGAYYDNPWDRGHLVRRAAVAWGESVQDARDASDSTFYYTNAAPQHERFNQDEWVDLEDWVLQSAGGISPRLCVFTGPIYTTHDQYHADTLRIPSAFWKIVVLRDPTANGSDLSAIGFVMKQNELWDDWNGAKTHDLRLYQVGITEIGGYTGLSFGDLANLDEFEWRQARFRDRSRMMPIEITGPGDITFHGDRRRERGIRAIPLGPPQTREGGSGTGTGLDSGCGCRGGVGEQKESDRVDALVQQVDALRDLVEALEFQVTQPGRQQDADRAMRGARAAYERIVGGETVEWGEFPECACIGNDNDWFCTGVLVAPRLVVTAAHCAPLIDKVYLGGRAHTLIGVDGTVVDVDKVIVHPDYDGWLTPSHDIALLILAEDADVEPTPIASNEEVAEEDNLLLVGFGFEHPTQNIGFGTKRKVDVPLTKTADVPADVIDALEEKHGFAAEWEVHAGRKYLGKDSCNGDSGGPAYIVVDGARKVAAVTSRAAHSSETRCGDGGIYTRIAPYIPWINTATNNMLGETPDEPATPAPPLPSINFYISASMPNPKGTDIGNEWVEITNACTTPASLTGWALADRQGGQHTLGGTIAGGGTLRVVLPGNSAVKLANSGDDIKLMRGNDEVQKVSYKSAKAGQVILFDQPASDDEEAGLPGAEPC